MQSFVPTLAPESVWTGLEGLLPRYYFDIDDGKHHVKDERGRFLANQGAAVSEALELLRTLRDVHSLQRRPGIAAIVVRDDKDFPIFEGSVDCDGR